MLKVSCDAHVSKIVMGHKIDDEREYKALVLSHFFVLYPDVSGGKMVQNSRRKNLGTKKNTHMQRTE